MAKTSVLLLLLVVALLIGLGITMLASTSFFTRDGGGEEYVTVWKQVVWLGVSLAACIIAALVDYNLWFRWRWYLLGAAAIGLALCYEWQVAQLLGYKPLIAARVNGASRWIGFGAMRVQPSEFAKIALIIALAAWFARHDSLERTFSTVFFSLDSSSAASSCS